MLIIWLPACPDCTRRSQTASDDSNGPKDFGMVRVAKFPS